MALPRTPARPPEQQQRDYDAVKHVAPPGVAGALPLQTEAAQAAVRERSEIGQTAPLVCNPRDVRL